MARSGDLGQVNRDTTEFHAGGKTLQQSAEQHQQRSQQPDAGVSRCAGYGDNADRHQRQGENQTGTPSIAVGISSQNDCAKRSHEKARTKRHERQNQRYIGSTAWKKRLPDVRSVITEHHEVIHFQEVSAGHAHDCPDLCFATKGRGRRDRASLKT